MVKKRMFLYLVYHDFSQYRITSSLFRGRLKKYLSRRSGEPFWIRKIYIYLEPEDPRCR